MIYSPKRTGDIIFKIIFYFSISTNISFYYFEFFLLKNLGAFDWYYSIIFFVIKNRNTILFSSDLYYWNFCIVCYGLFFIQLKFLSSKINYLNFSFYQENYHITKPHHKFTIDITQIIYRNIQIHIHHTSKISKN